ncbi:DUF1496 domain-containing protein [Brevibacillus porteri]|uniref:DUF1496 domain-containing protein n=1 Tax=Brevibacillus porteri TaxID=2126350 RepID=UPI003D1AAABE
MPNNNEELNVGMENVESSTGSVCIYNGQTYSTGATVCQADGLLYRCGTDGSWGYAGSACPK